MKTKDPLEIPFDDLIEALLDFDVSFPPKFLYRLSDLSRSDLDRLTEIWEDIPTWRRKALLEDLTEMSKRDFLLAYNQVGKLAIQDPDAEVRLAAVNTLAEYEDHDLIQIFMDVLKNDESDVVRTAAAGALGRFVYAGEIGEINTRIFVELESLLLEIMNNDETPRIQQQTLESLGFSSNEEIFPHIEKAYQSNDIEWVSSSAVAMGRSADERWVPHVIKLLNNKQPSIRREAARAAGELEIQEAVPRLLELLEDVDEGTRLASIWSLSQIGGEGIREAIEALFDESEYDFQEDFLESALDNLAFTEDGALFPLFDFPDQEELEYKNDLDNPQDYDR